MVQLIESDTIEHEYYNRIEVCCGDCNQALADFSRVKSVNKFWEINSDDIDWDVQYTVQVGTMTKNT